MIWSGVRVTGGMLLSSGSVVQAAFYSCTIIWAAHRFALPDFSSCHWFTHCA